MSRHALAFSAAVHSARVELLMWRLAQQRQEEARHWLTGIAAASHALRCVNTDAGHTKETVMPNTPPAGNAKVEKVPKNIPPDELIERTSQDAQRSESAREQHRDPTGRDKNKPL